MKQTHTLVTLNISEAAYEEIAQKLREAGYSHVFSDQGEIDMSGIAFAKGAVEQPYNDEDGSMDSDGVRIYG